MQKPLSVVPIAPPPAEQRARRGARFALPGEKRDRYSLPEGLASASPVGYRTRVPLTRAEAEQALKLLALDRPTAFAPPLPVTERELFEESALGTLSSRQSTNYRGHRQVTLGPDASTEVAGVLRRMGPTSAVLDGASYTHVVLTRPYRTAFTFLLTFVGHAPLLNLLTVPTRALRKLLFHEDDIPTIGWLQLLHVGILADAMDRAAVLASGGRRRAQVHLSPFASKPARQANAAAIAELEALVGLTGAERRAGWRIALVAQVGEAVPAEAVGLPAGLARKLGANLLAARSERIQPGVNAEEKAPDAFQRRQDMDVPEELAAQAGRAAYNAFAHWTGIDREAGKQLLLLDRIDVLTPGGKERLRTVRTMLNEVTDRVIGSLPLWVELPTGRALSRNADRGRKAFALAGQRIYVAGLSRRELAAAGLDWDLAVHALGAAAGRSALYAEIMGTVDLPPECDLLAGICLMAGPVNQNDIGKTFFGQADLLAPTFGDRDPTSLLVWTLKAKTVADPIGNEEQLLAAARKGALVDLRPGPHEAITIRRGGKLEPMRRRDGRVNAERAFGDVGNFVTSSEGVEIPGNRGEPWPWADEIVWPSARG